jgi:hypothetical protein
VRALLVVPAWLVFAILLVRASAKTGSTAPSQPAAA